MSEYPVKNEIYDALTKLIYRHYPDLFTSEGIDDRDRAFLCTLLAERTRYATHEGAEIDLAYWELRKEDYLGRRTQQPS